MSTWDALPWVFRAVCLWSAVVAFVFAALVVFRAFQVAAALLFGPVGRVVGRTARARRMGRAQLRALERSLGAPSVAAELCFALGGRAPLKHLGLWPGTRCENWRVGDVRFVIGKTYPDGVMGDDYPPCPVCWPQKPAAL